MRRLSRVQSTLALTLALLALMAAGCTRTVDPTTTVSTAQTTTTSTLPPTTTTEPPPELHGGIALVGIEAEPSTLNPFFAGDDSTVRLVAQAWSAGVADISGNGERIPDVVTELPTVTNGGVVTNDDGTTTISYHIREEAQWADGVPITGADFQFTLDTILDPGLSIPKGLYAEILSSRVGEKTFSFTLSIPTIEHEDLFDILIPRHAVEGSSFAADWNGRTWLAAGPFQLERWEPGESISFTRNDSYWKSDPDNGAELPYLDGVEFVLDSGLPERILSFAAGQLDVMEATRGPTADQLESLERLGAVVETRNGSVWVHLNFQFGPNATFRNSDTFNPYTAFRQAIMHAVDRERIVDEVFGSYHRPLQSYVAAFSSSLSQEAWVQYDYDPERAVALLTDAAVTRAEEEDEPVPVKVIFTTNAENEERVLVAEMLGEMFEAVGIEYVEDNEDSLTFFGETVSGGRWDMGMWAWQSSPSLNDLVRFHNVLDPTDDAVLTNFYRWGTVDSVVRDASTQQFRSLLTAMGSTVDREELIPLINQAESIVADQAVILPLYAEPVVAAYWPSAIDGFEMNGSGFTWNIEQWRMLDLD